MQSAVAADYRNLLIVRQYVSKKNQTKNVKKIVTDIKLGLRLGLEL